jgi:hypothetical protein
VWTSLPTCFSLKTFEAGMLHLSQPNLKGYFLLNVKDSMRVGSQVICQEVSDESLHKFTNHAAMLFHLVFISESKGTS